MVQRLEARFGLARDEPGFNEAAPVMVQRRRGATKLTSYRRGFNEAAPVMVQRLGGDSRDGLAGPASMRLHR